MTLPVSLRTLTGDGWRAPALCTPGPLLKTFLSIWGEDPGFPLTLSWLSYGVLTFPSGSLGEETGSWRSWATCPGPHTVYTTNLDEDLRTALSESKLRPLYYITVCRHCFQERVQVWAASNKGKAEPGAILGPSASQSPVQLCLLEEGNGSILPRLLKHRRREGRRKQVKYETPASQGALAFKAA